MLAGGTDSRAVPVRVASLEEVRTSGCLTVQIKGRTLLLIAAGERIHALDNRCPHMGFPLHRGTVKEGILTCHWHHARFDLSSGGTFDQWADDVQVFPVEVRDGQVWVDLRAGEDPKAHHQGRLRVGLERNLSLVIAKSVLQLFERGDFLEAFRQGLEFGTGYRQNGWGQGLTILTCMVNLLEHLDQEDKPRALYHGLSAVALDCADMPPRFAVPPLPARSVEMFRLKGWFRQFVEVRDAEGAERCIVTAVRGGATREQMVDMLFAAATDHRHIQTGHVLDFTNKAFEALDQVGWELAEPVLSSLATGYAEAARMEESKSWRHPVDLVALLEEIFERLPAALEEGAGRRGEWEGQSALVSVLLGEDPRAIAEALLEALKWGCPEERLAQVVACAAALRIARFHTSNEFGDWDTALHTFTFANAVQQALHRVSSRELLRGVFDAAMSVYLDRFLNVPPAPLPEVKALGEAPENILKVLPSLLDRQQQVNETGSMVARYLASGGEPERLLGALGGLLLREDRDFHTIQMVEAAFRQFLALPRSVAGIHVLVAAARYLSAHAPTMRAQEQTYQIARRLHRGETLHEV